MLKMSKLYDWPAEEIADKAWELAREDKNRFANQDADLLEKVKEGISGDLCSWGAIEMGSSAASKTALGDLTNKVLTQTVEGRTIRYSSKGQIHSCAVRTGNTPPGGVGPGRWSCLLWEMIRLATQIRGMLVRHP